MAKRILEKNRRRSVEWAAAAAEDLVVKITVSEQGFSEDLWFSIAVRGEDHPQVVDVQKLQPRGPGDTDDIRDWVRHHLNANLGSCKSYARSCNLILTPDERVHFKLRWGV